MKQFNRIKIEIILQYFIELIFATRSTDEANTMHNTAKSKTNYHSKMVCLAHKVQTFLKLNKITYQ